VATMGSSFFHLGILFEGSSMPRYLEILILISSAFCRFARIFVRLLLLGILLSFQASSTENSASVEEKAAASETPTNEKEISPASEAAKLPTQSAIQGSVQVKTAVGASKTAPPLEPEKVKKQIDKFPRWRKLDRYRKAMLLEDNIWVVAKTRDSDVAGFDEELYIAGAGMTKANKNQAFRQLKKFSEWTELSDYVVASDYSEEKSELFLHLKAYGYFAKMHMDVAFASRDDSHDLFMKVIKGHFLGMTVGFRIQKDAKSRNSEILMTALHPFETLPLPRFFVEFGLEVVFQQLGQRLRQKMELGPLNSTQATNN
jgi:hypothetical protein